MRRARPDLPICDAFLDAAAEDGFPVLDDLDTDAGEGFAFYDINAGGGRRMSTATAYLEPAARRPNLDIRTGVLALRAVVEGGRASGVEALIGGRRVRISARREVVLSAGAIKTPQLLMLSGIGLADALSSHGIPVVRDARNVGGNLQNHACYRLQYLCSAPVVRESASAPAQRRRGSAPLRSVRKRSARRDLCRRRRLFPHRPGP